MPYIYCSVVGQILPNNFLTNINLPIFSHCTYTLTLHADMSLANSVSVGYNMARIAMLGKHKTKEIVQCCNPVEPSWPNSVIKGSDCNTIALCIANIQPVKSLIYTQVILKFKFIQLFREFSTSE